MSGQRRVQQQAAFVLHHRPFRDSSQILDVLSREHGKLAVVARGSRGARSRLKGVLRPFMPLSLSGVIKSDLGTLTGAEVNGAPLRLTGEALLSGYYINELVLHFLHRHDPQPEVFDIYAQSVEALATSGAEIAAVLRQFEIALLRHSGYALNLEHESGTASRLVSPVSGSTGNDHLHIHMDRAVDSSRGCPSSSSNRSKRSSFTPGFPRPCGR